MAKTMKLILQEFADDVKTNVGAAAEGEPEAQLTGPVSVLLKALGPCFDRKLIAKAESATPDRLGIPDFAIVDDGLLAGYVELKAPGEGADTARFKGRNKQQWERFKAQPNIVYTDGNEWCLYRDGEPIAPPLRFLKDIVKHGAKAISPADIEGFEALWRKMLAWTPKVSEQPKEQATLLAPLCRLLRDDVSDALKDPESPLKSLASDWREFLFPDASDARFADSYAQTVTFALLLARSEGAKFEKDDLGAAVAKLEADHTLLSRALQVLTDTGVRKEIESSVALLLRVIGHFPNDALKPTPGADADHDPWLFFYEHFLAAYDPKLRKDSGVYYTPVQVVQCQVALVDELLRTRLKKSDGFASKDVVTLDPAVGTGTYLLGVIEHALSAVAAKQGPGAVASRASALAENLFGFELMTGPYAVAELRITRDLASRGATLPKDGIGVYLADTLESPDEPQPKLPQYLQPIAQQHLQAQQVKKKKTVIVCLGNPPYDRHDAAVMDGNTVAESDRARTGGWVRWGDDGDPELAILNSFAAPARDAGHGGDLKNLYNLYVYFWRWAIWKVFQHPTGTAKELHAPPELDKYTDAPGIVSFITASSYIRGDAFLGMREMLRRLCDDVWIIDLGGEGRGTRQDDNVFNILSPVAICIALRAGKKDPKKAGTVHYTSVLGSQKEKYAKLAAVRSFKGLDWQPCPAGWHSPMRPAGIGAYFSWPLLADLMPWQTNGLKVGRLWPIAVDRGSIDRRWKRLIRSAANERRELFKDSPTGRQTLHRPFPLNRGGDQSRLDAVASLTASSPHGGIVSFCYRAFDRQFLLSDARVIDRPNPSLWRSCGPQQLFLSTLSTATLAGGPALVASAAIPDLHVFRGSFGAKDVFPLYRDAAASEPNLLPGLVELWGDRLKRSISPNAFAAYAYAVGGHKDFVTKFWAELEDRELRIPLTTDAKLFDKAVKLGSQLLFLHTFGERFNPTGVTASEVPVGTAKAVRAISDKPIDYPNEFKYLADSGTLVVGGGAIEGVSSGVWNFSVSGLQVLDSWLGNRMKDRRGRRSSPLDEIHPERWTSDFTDELLKLLWLLEHSLAIGPTLGALLNDVCAGPLLSAAELPSVPPHLRKAPRAETSGLFDDNDGASEEEE